MSTASVPIQVPSSGFGAPVNVDNLVGEKTVTLSGRYSGAYVLYGSHDGVRFAPLLIFNAGGIESIRQTFKGAFSQLKIKSLASGAAGVVANVSGLSVPGDNSFTSLGVGIVLDLGDDLYQVDLNFMGFGRVNGAVVVEGSLDGNGFNPIGEFASSQAGASLLGGGAIEFSPIATPDRVRYVRLNVQGSADPGFLVTVGGAQSESGAAETLAAAYAAGASAVDQTMIVLPSNGGRVVFDGTGLPPLPPSPPYSSETVRILGIPRTAQLTLGPDNIVIGIAGTHGIINIAPGVRDCVVLGDNMQVLAGAGEGVAIGFSVDITGSGQVAIGSGAQARSDNAVALGSATAGGENSVAIGYNTACGGDNGVAIGEYSWAYQDSDIAIGAGAFTDLLGAAIASTGSVQFPAQSAISNGDTLTVGGQTITAWDGTGVPVVPYADLSVAGLSLQQVAQAFASVMDISFTVTPGTPSSGGLLDLVSNVAGLAGNVPITGNLPGAIYTGMSGGLDALDHNIAIGVVASVVGGAGNVAIGDGAQVSGACSVVIGTGAQATAKDAVAIGMSATAGADYAIALGAYANAFIPNTMVIGDSAAHPAGGEAAIHTFTIRGFNVVPIDTVFTDAPANDYQTGMTLSYRYSGGSVQSKDVYAQDVVPPGSLKLYIPGPPP
jgi:hypothetical protein